MKTHTRQIAARTRKRVNRVVTQVRARVEQHRANMASNFIAGASQRLGARAVDLIFVVVGLWLLRH